MGTNLAVNARTPGSRTFAGRGNLSLFGTTRLDAALADPREAAECGRGRMPTECHRLRPHSEPTTGL